jgi:hypothetical protein
MRSVCLPGIALAVLTLMSGAHADSLLVLSVDVRDLDGPSFEGQRQVTVRFINDSVLSDPRPWVVAAVPIGFVIVEGSVRGPGASVAFSTDGSTSFFSDRGRELSEGPRITHIRWQLDGPIEPGVSGIVSFRIRPEVATTDEAG